MGFGRPLGLQLGYGKWSLDSEGVVDRLAEADGGQKFLAFRPVRRLGSAPFTMILCRSGGLHFSYRRWCLDAIRVICSTEPDGDEKCFDFHLVR